MLKGEPPAPANAKDVIVAGERLGWLGDATKIEYSRLAVVLLITVAGLLVGARDELAKLDLIPGLIAVFMLGFTADQIKNILAPPASQ
jgi:Flp pilus assembly pilin Flp